MNSWLIGLSSRPQTEEEVLKSTLRELPVSELEKLAFDIDPLSVPTKAEILHEKLAAAEKNGRELARENGVLQKIAFVPALLAGAARLAPLAGRAVGALGGAKSVIGGVAKDMAIGTAANKVMGALKPAAPAASAAGEVAGGFKYAFAGGLLQRAAGYAVRNPGTAVTAAGALGGALMAPRDAQTGQKQYLRGAVMGGVGMAGVNAVSNGALANKMRSSVMNRQSPLLGQGTRQYLMDSAAATKAKMPSAGGYVGKAVPDMTAHTTPVPPSAGEQAVRAMPKPSTPGWSSAHRGMQEAQERTSLLNSLTPNNLPAPRPAAVKLAEQRFFSLTPAQQILFVAIEKKASQELAYNPATRTFVRPQQQAPMAGSRNNVEPSAVGPESITGK